MDKIEQNVYQFVEFEDLHDGGIPQAKRRQLCFLRHATTSNLVQLAGHFFRSLVRFSKTLVEIWWVFLDK